MAEQDPPRNPEAQGQGNTNTDYVAAITEQIGTPLRHLSSQVTSLTNEMMANNEKEESERRKYQTNELYWLKVGTRSSIISAALGFVVSVLTLLVLNNTLTVVDKQRQITGDQLKVMEGQLKEMQVAQRPWVSADVQIAGPLVFGANGSSIPLKITLKNTGHTPATRILAIPRIFVREEQPMDFLAIQKRRCEAGRRPAGPSGGIGYTLFPGDTVTEYNTPTMTHEEFGNQRTIVPYLVVCINYQFTFSGQNHQTSAMYVLMRVDPTRPGAFVINPQDGSVPTNNLRFQFLRSYAD